MSAEEVSRALSAINQAWLEGRPRDLSALFDPKIVTLVPGCVRVEGREALVQSFVDMCENARVHAFEERDRQVDVFGDAAVASVAFTIAYERVRFGGAVLSAEETVEVTAALETLAAAVRARRAG